MPWLLASRSASSFLKRKNAAEIENKIRFLFLFRIGSHSRYVIGQFSLHHEVQQLAEAVL